MSLRSLSSLCTHLRLCTRKISYNARLFEATKFGMPAMSPTMEKGGIISWKFKEGDSFSAGDVLLEVETDKAQIDVEAQDDGKLAKIIANDGTKDVNVGEVIAYLAEPDDDLSTLKLPDEGAPEENVQDNTNDKQSNTNEVSAPESSVQEKNNQNEVHKQESTSTDTNVNQVLFPSVSLLMAQNNIQVEDVLGKIKPSGRNGTILKGDVLAYLGKISKDSVANIANYVKKSEKLDLSTIELMLPSKISEREESVGAKIEKKRQPELLHYDLIINVSRGTTSEALNESISSYIQKYYCRSHKEPLMDVKSKNYSPLFEDLIKVEPKNIRFTVDYKLSPLEKESKSKRQDDILNLLANNKEETCIDEFKEQRTSMPYALLLDVTVSPKYDDSKRRAEEFIKYIKQLESEV
ncbi:Pdx1p NDAI_0D02180 [Naumovozyma dairenensis CBS 421]|uniref:Lipoyl-binding domain-containing protein n=1 Tax=Naumovozyma dairenensis (strain ATCC 10597 / BCRC 20456 / CBS 421 / NBRC 0211 / NRRL Y-12639) TaxID=1071378 RepID=G0W9S1_NAUDC|nr:hypothetical protein NDAI_0D02180 [Naumovozyma dairenensis CBS 421]CCD24532.1 hypothetical protein NDAI_0D02180 [Naumovozyma dairenensis CBS 421]